MAVKTNKENQIVIRRLKSLYNFSDEAIIARIAINYSLQLNKKFDIDTIHELKLDSSGKEYKDETLFGQIGDYKNGFIYKSLFEIYYDRNLNENDFLKIIKLHLDFGLEMLNHEILERTSGRNVHIDFLINKIKKGVDLISDIFPIATTKLKNLKSYNELIEFELGKNEKNERIVIRLNDLKEFNSHHIAVAGMTGSGKTELIKDILFQIKKKTKNELKFIFFDYKGEGNSNKILSFLESTDCKLIDFIEKEFDLNPLSFVNLSNEKLKLGNIKSFIDTVMSIETKFGPKQKHKLDIITTRCFDRITDGNYPTIHDIFNELEKYYEENNESPDSLFSIMKDLDSFLFRNENPTSKAKIYEENLYLNLPPTFSDTLRQLCVFLTLNYLLFEFISSNDTEPDENSIKPIRYIIIIDEAHVYLKKKNARKKLEDLLRLIRSKGVVVILLSQGIEDYKTSDFDFASQIQIPICLNMQNKDYKTIKSFVGTPKSEQKLKEVINKLENGKALINLKEPQIIEINQFWKSIKQ
jgi:DNA sulfur modification protein DndE